MPTPSTTVATFLSSSFKIRIMDESEHKIGLRFMPFCEPKNEQCHEMNVDISSGWKLEQEHHRRH